LAIALDEDEKIYIHGNIEFILLHEFAHILINDLGIPIIGPEEHAADYLATIALIRPERFDVNRANRARQYVLAVANGFATTWELDKPLINKLPYWDNHGLTIQRFYNVGCLLYGSNPDIFPRLPTLMKIPESRTSRCQMEYEKASKSVDWLLENYGRKNDDETSEVVISYGMAQTEISKQILTSIRESNLIEKIVARFNELFSLSNPFTIRTQDCRKRQAYWDSDNRVLTICHELFDFYYSLSRNPHTNIQSEILKEDDL
jgi:hypothetical protein